MMPQCRSSKPKGIRVFVALLLLTALGCSSSPSSPSGNDVTAGGSNAIGGNGGVSAAAGGITTHASAGGTLAASGGNSTSLGGKSTTGGVSSTSAGGKNATGASAGTGVGGTTQSTLATGGTSANGGSGGLGAGGTSASGGARTGGTSGVLVGTGGTPGGAGAGGKASTGGRTAEGAAGRGASAGNTLYVATTGDDTNPGTKDKPFKTVGAAQVAVRASSDRGKIPLTVSVATGTYYLTKPIVFTSADSGTVAAPITYTGGGTATLSGGAKLNLTWSSYKNGIMQATVPASASSGLSFDVLFLNGQRQVMARYPNYKAGVAPFGGVASDYTSSARVSKWTHSPAGGFVHCMHTSNWGSQHYVIKSASAGNLSLDGPYCNARASGQNGSGMVENIFEELDAPGEWYFDKAAGVLYFYPPTGTDLTTATIEVAGIETLIQFNGTSTAPVQWINLDGFHFTATSRTFAKCNETILRSDWLIYRGGSLFIVGAEDTTITNSFFDNLGGNAVFVSGYNRRVSVAHNKFVGVGASAILFMGLSSAVRNPLFGYYAGTVSVSALDKTPGPLTSDYPAQCDATDNLIHDIGDPQKQMAGVGIDMAQDITVVHNSIYSVPRAGINIGDGCWGGHLLQYNDVFDTVLETGDHGAFNSWGRDRFWDASVSTIESRVTSFSGSTPIYLLDVVKPITIKNNRWRCDHGWDVDLDDGSTNYVITNNLFLSGGLKWREGYNRTGDNNMFNTAAKMSVHVWPKNNGDIFTHNIFAGYDPASPDGWGKTLDYNLFTNAAALTTAHGYGVDAHSASATNPGYVDAANGNYQLSPNSPALALGIQSIPVDPYGVTSLSLKAQARTPFFGTTTTTTSSRSTRTELWRGAAIRNLIGLNDQSAVGLGSDVGVIVDTIPAGTVAANDGLQALDVILQFNGKSIVSLDDLDAAYSAATTGQQTTLGLWRLQRDTTLTITR